MRTTIRLDDTLLDKAKREAARRGMTLTALIGEGLRLALRRPPTPRPRERISLPVSRSGGGTQPGVDLDNSADLLARMDEDA